ncbi:MAG: SUMF1/EgtB/PvdO family nonheme iron enzyme [Chloroflexota bacterium]
MTKLDYSIKASIGLTHRIPSGYFTMGSRFHMREQPARQVFVSEIDMANMPVTVGQYETFVESDAYQQERWWSKPGWEWYHGQSDGWGRENRKIPDAWTIQKRRISHPVVGISYFEAEAYCNWLSFYKKKAIRLPDEKEWEYAARGSDGRPYPWGEEFDPVLTNTLESERFDTVESATMDTDASPFDVHDMAGNVQEWTSSLYEPLPGELFPSGILHVSRGGSFNDTAYGARTSYRRAYPPGYFFSFLGFRVVVENR